MASVNLQSRTFEVHIEPQKTITVRIAESRIAAEGLSLTTWTSAFLLAKQLPLLEGIKPNQVEGNIPILELGAGTGLVGITAAFTWNSTVVLTDLEPIVPGLLENIVLNKALFAGSDGVRNGRLLCGALDWRDPPSLRLYSKDVDHDWSDRMPSKANVILAADTVYSEEHPELLSQTILAWLAPGQQSRAIICYALRVAYLDQIRELWQMLEAGGLEAIAEGQERADETPDDTDDELLCEWCVWKWKDVTS